MRDHVRVAGGRDEHGGLTEGGESLQVTHHIYVGSKARWDVIGDDGKQHQAALGD
jgi:hypothetical protein